MVPVACNLDSMSIVFGKHCGFIKLLNFNLFPFNTMDHFDKK